MKTPVNVAQNTKYVRVAFVLGVLIFYLFAHAHATASAAQKTVINFSLLVFNGEQRSAYARAVKAFEKSHPTIKVNIQALESESYKRQIEGWLAADAHSDVMYWFGGERLNWYIRQGWVAALTDLWYSSGWDDRMTAGAKSAVSVGDTIYALPMHYYHWGIYYRSSLFADLGIAPPTDWNAFLKAARTLQHNDITPLALGSQETWPLAGWFDYFNLRLNGLEFHRDLVAGRVSYHHPALKTVFAHWREIIDQGFLLNNHAALTWREAIPFLYRGTAGMFLMGNFWTSQIPPSLRKDFAVIPFPQMRDDMPMYEEAPTNVLFVPANAKQPQAARLFLRFMARPDIQVQLNEAVGMMAPLKAESQVQSYADHFLRAGKQILEQAEGISQYFDRDNPQLIATEGMKQFARFVANPDELPQVLDALEALRRKSFSVQAAPDQTRQ